MAVIQFSDRKKVKGGSVSQLYFKYDQVFKIPYGVKSIDLCLVGAGGSGSGPIFCRFSGSVGGTAGHGRRLECLNQHGMGGYVNTVRKIPVNTGDEITIKVGRGDYIGNKSYTPNELNTISQNPNIQFYGGGGFSYVYKNGVLIASAAGGGGYYNVYKSTKDSDIKYMRYSGDYDDWSYVDQLIPNDANGSSTYVYENWIPIEWSNTGRPKKYNKYWINSGRPLWSNQKYYGCSKWLFDEPDSILFGQNGVTFGADAVNYTGNGSGGGYMNNKHIVTIYPGKPADGIIYMRTYASDRRDRKYPQSYWQSHTYEVIDGNIIKYKDPRYIVKDGLLYDEERIKDVFETKLPNAYKLKFTQDHGHVKMENDGTWAFSNNSSRDTLITCHHDQYEVKLKSISCKISTSSGYIPKFAEIYRNHFRDSKSVVNNQDILWEGGISGPGGDAGINENESFNAVSDTSSVRGIIQNIKYEIESIKIKE